MIRVMRLLVFGSCQFTKLIVIGFNSLSETHYTNSVWSSCQYKQDSNIIVHYSVSVSLKDSVPNT